MMEGGSMLAVASLTEAQALVDEFTLPDYLPTQV